MSTIDDPFNGSSTIVQVGSAPAVGNKFVFKTSASELSAPDVGTTLTDWTDLPGNGNITATNGHYVYVAEINATTNRVVKFGSASAVVINYAPAAVANLSVSIVENGAEEKSASDLATDQEADTLALVADSASSMDESIATVAIVGNRLEITSIAAGSTDVKVNVTDGNSSTEITIPVTVTP